MNSRYHPLIGVENGTGPRIEVRFRNIKSSIG